MKCRWFGQDVDMNLDEMSLIWTVFQYHGKRIVLHGNMPSELWTWIWMKCRWFGQDADMNLAEMSLICTYLAWFICQIVHVFTLLLFYSCPCVSVYGLVFVLKYRNGISLYEIIQFAWLDLTWLDSQSVSARTYSPDMSPKRGHEPWWNILDLQSVSLFHEV